MAQLQNLSQHKSQSFSIDWHDYVKGVPCGPLPILNCSASNNQCMKMCLKYSRRMRHLSSPRLFLSEIHPLCVFPPGVYDEDGQWMIQVNRLQKLIDRLEQKVTSFLSTFPYALLSCLPLLFSSASVIFIFVYLLSPSRPSGLYIAFSD